MRNDEVQVGMKVRWEDFVAGEQIGTVIEALPIREDMVGGVAGQFFKVSVNSGNATFSQRKLGYAIIMAGLMEIGEKAWLRMKSWLSKPILMNLMVW